MSTSSFKTPKKGSGHGATHWMMQRITAVALIFLVIISVIFYICAVNDGVSAMAVFNSPFKVTIGVLLFGTAFYHSFLGMKVIIEDYISCPCGRTIAINIVRFVNIALGAGAIISLILIAVDSRLTVLA